MKMIEIAARAMFAVVAALAWLPCSAWPGMPMPQLHVEGRWLVDEEGNHVNLHGFGQTYSPWFNEMNSKWYNYDVNACLKYNKGILDGVLDDAGWKMTYVRMHMDPYWSNKPGVKTEGEHDISAFDMERFKTYLDKVFIPMAEYAVSKGLYVVMRPPGVCPQKIEVGGKYHNYLKQVWAYVALQERLTKNPHIMFELANEPVEILGEDGNYSSWGDGAYKSLTRFFQEIVDIMRENGCQNILWVPGTGYQSQYAGFAKYPVKGKNIGYAVHVYPGWYGSDAIEPSHELGGSYGGGYSSFAAGWKAQIEPCAAIAPMLVTEMDWMPKTYEASWGKSITGKMLGAGFGANFKLLADRTGNVGWMLFTGPELLARFRGEKGAEGNHTMYTDPEACMWPAYHWYNEYAGAQLPPVESVDLYFSPRKGAVDGKLTMQTGCSTGAALIADRGIGVDFNIQGGIEAETAEPEIVSWEKGSFRALRPGTTDCVVRYTVDGMEQEKMYTLESQPFPMEYGYFNPSIWEEGTFDQETGVFTTGQYGFAGWKFADGLDLSGSNYLIADVESAKNGLSFRAFDINNYWSDPVIVDFGNSPRAVINLRDMKSSNGRKMDRSHIYIVGFWTYGGQPIKLKQVFVADSPDASGVAELESDAPADEAVYNLMGVKVADGMEGAVLSPGIYVTRGRKVAVR